MRPSSQPPPDFPVSLKNVHQPPASSVAPTPASALLAFAYYLLPSSETQLSMLPLSVSNHQ